MCGILNVISKNGRSLNLSACRRALSYLTWRGPDLEVINIWEHRVFMGQTVLSLTGDLMEKAGESFQSSSGRFLLNYNGEIYNYKELKSRWLDGKINIETNKCVDTQVLLNLHDQLPKQKIPKILDGMYAYSLLDKEKRLLSICRDIQGEKSLYVYENSELIIISSEISPILSLMPRIKKDKQVFRDYFRVRHFMFFERTPYEGIRQLSPGSFESLNLDSMQWVEKQQNKLSDWIDPDRMMEYSERSEGSLVDELDCLMDENIKQMIPSKHKFASVVSGGVDSSLISYYVNKHANPETFVAVNHIGKDRISMDLSGFEVVLGQKIKILNVNSEEYSRKIVDCQKICGSPLLAHSFVGQSIQSSYVRKIGCKALFGGEGADELFGGYPCYLENGNTLERYSPSLYTKHYEPKLKYKEDFSKKITTELEDAWILSLDAYKHKKNCGERIVQAMMYCDFAYQLPSVGLRGADLMSMMWSIQTRSVFLRPEIIKFALNLPVKMKADMSTELDPLLRSKKLLKLLFLRYFPKKLLVKKQGFAGFPNESAKYLSGIKDYITLDILGVKSESLNNEILDKADAWKLTNLEYYLR